MARAARGLQAIGVFPGTRVGLMLPNTPYFVVLYFAVLKAGGVVVCFNPLLAEREIEQQIADSGVEIMATLDLGALYGKLARVLERRPIRHLVVCRMSCILPTPKRQLFRILRRREVANVPTDERHVWFERLIVNDGRVDTPVCEPERTVAMLQYTGGTTGTPKGAELTHANLYVNAMQVGRWFHGCKPGQERILGVLPLFHIFGMATVMNVGPAARGRADPAAEVRDRPADADDPQQAADDLPGRADPVRGDYPLRGARPVRPVLDRDLRVGRRTAAGRDQGQLRAPDRLRHRRGLRPDRGVAGGVHQPGRRRAQDRLDRPAAAAHRRSTSSPWKMAEPRSRKASAASCACVARR